MQFKLNDFHRDVPDAELIADLKSAADVLGQAGKRLTSRSYGTVGRYSASTISARFRSWNNALQAAGLEIGQHKDAAPNDLFENLRAVWTAKGRCPVFRDMSALSSQFGTSAYIARFGSWRKALEAFVEYVNSDQWVATDERESPVSSPRPERRTTRSISERMRFRILLRDGFACQSCGASPLKVRDIELHVDHVVPWSKGGETVADNLQTKCSQCNLGKGDAFNQ